MEKPRRICSRCKLTLASIIYMSKEVNKGLSPGRRIKEEWGSVVYWWFGIEQDQPLIM